MYKQIEPGRMEKMTKKEFNKIKPNQDKLKMKEEESEEKEESQPKMSKEDRKKMAIVIIGKKMGKK